MSTSQNPDFRFTPLTPAKNLEEVWKNFDPTLVIDPTSDLYILRIDPGLKKLSFEIRMTEEPLHAFLCGHRGSGKTTELARLCNDPAINDKYLPVYLTAQSFGGVSRSGASELNSVS